MPPPLTNLYTKPNDVYTKMSIEGIQLRLDDHRLQTGQLVTATADAVLGAVSVSVQPLQYPLLNGSTLVFEGSGMAGPITVTLAALAKVGDAALTVAPLSGQVNNQAQAQDNGVNLATAQRLVQACNYATARVKFYCCGRYDDSQLVNSWSVNRWATDLATKWLCGRGGQTPPKSVEEDVEEALLEMRGVQSGAYRIEDIGTRTAGWPFLSNVTVDQSYTYAKIRVEPYLSEGTPTQYPQYVDWNSIFYAEYF